MATDIREKIRALLAKAEASEHPGEAQLFFTKAQELMEEHQVELFELHQTDPIGQTDGVKAQAGPPSYKSDVQCALAAYYGCRAVLSGTAKKWTVRLVGPESARLTTELMTDYVWAQVCAAAGKMAAESTIDMRMAIIRGTAMNKQQAIRQIAKALVIRIHREIRQRKPAEAQRPGTSLSLVVVDAVENYLAVHFPELTSSKSRPIKTTMNAMHHAKGISLNHQVSTGRGTLRLE